MGLPIVKPVSKDVRGDKDDFQSRHTVSSTLGSWALATTTADSDTVDNIALLGLVTQSTSLVGAGWTGSAVDDVQLAELYYALSAMFNECIAGTVEVHIPHILRRPGS